MFREKTVFVVGAGASMEVGLPIGEKLKKIIFDKLDYRANTFGQRDGNHGDDEIFYCLSKQNRTDLNECFRACTRIRDGIVLAESIDDFLDVHNEDSAIVLCGKAAITKAILDSEKSCALFYDPGNIYNTIDFRGIENTWFVSFFRLLKAGIKKSNLSKIFDNVTIICFNYDRCIEHFLVHAITAHYQIKKEGAIELVKQLKILRPFGSVGDYFGVSGRQVNFGIGSLGSVDEIRDAIKTYTDQVDSNEMIAMQDSIINAGVVVFLGNAFHDNNMRLITPEKPTKVRKRIYSTRFGISDADLRVVTEKLIRLSGNGRTARPMPQTDYFWVDKCANLFSEYRMSLRN